MSTILYRDRLSDHEFTKHLSRHCNQAHLVPHSNGAFDYGCGSSLVLVHDFQSLEQTGDRAGVCRRVEEAQKLVTARGTVVLLVTINVAEPSLEVLSWLNLDCGVLRRCSVVLCWSLDEASQFLETLASASSLSVSYRRQGRTGSGDSRGAVRGPETAPAHAEGAEDKGNPFEIIKEALTQTPQFLTGGDVVRIVNRHRTVADLLLQFAPNAVTDLPGVSTKKAQRLHDVLHAPFHTSLPGVADFLPGPAGEDRTGATSIMGADPVALLPNGSSDAPQVAKEIGVSSAVGEALSRIRLREDAEDGDE